MKVLVLNPVMQRDLHLFEHLFQNSGVETLCPPLKQYLSDRELMPFMGQVDGIIAGDDQFTREVLEAGLPRLKVISKWGVGLDSFDLDAAKDLGIPVYNSPGAFSTAVAEVAIGYMLMLSRFLKQVDDGVRAGKWLKPEGEGLAGKTLGIVGLGAIGRAIADRASAFGMTTNAFDVMSAVMDPPSGGSFMSFEDLCRTSDFICLSCNLTEDNHHLINEASIKLMEKRPFIINVGRGPLVDEEALVMALQNDGLRGAGLDVYEVEPLSTTSPLLELPNVILGSHNANNLASANNYVNQNTLKNLFTGLGLSIDF